MSDLRNGTALDLGIDGVVCLFCEEPIEPTDEISEMHDPVEENNVWAHDYCREDLRDRMGLP